MKKVLKKGDLITLLYVSSSAMTTRQKVIFERYSEDNLKIIYKPGPRKRKLFQIDLSKVTFMFLGHEQPFEIDSDGSVFMINACMNLVSKKPVNEIRNWLEENNLKEIVSEEHKAHIMLTTREEANNTENELDYTNCLYPKTTNSSSLVNGIRSKNAPKVEVAKAKDEAELKEFLDSFYGTGTFYQHILDREFVYTDGTKEYMERVGGYWISDIIVALFLKPIRDREPEIYYLKMIVTEQVKSMNKAYIQLFDYNGEVLRDLFIDTDHILGVFNTTLGWNGEVSTWCLNSEN